MAEQTLDRPAALMAESADSDASPNAVVPSTSWHSDAGNTFDYVPVSPWGPIALVLGLMSLSAFLGLFGIILAFSASLIALISVFRIRAEAGLVKGAWMAVCGLVLAVSSVSAGSAKMAWDYAHECPEGYARVNFPNDIAAKQFIYLGSIRRLHPDVAPLVDQKVFLKGFMWQTQQTERLRGFVLLKDNGECCFGGKPKPYDMMWVEMQGDQTTRAYSSLVAVAGTLTVNLSAGEDEPVYIMKADQVEEARTSF